MDSLPRIAIVLVHVANKLDFSRYLVQLDKVTSPYPVTLYIINAPKAAKEAVQLDDIERLATPVRLISGDSTAEVAALQQGVLSVHQTDEWILIMRNMLLYPDWYKKICSVIKHYSPVVCGAVYEKGQVLTASAHHQIIKTTIPDIQFMSCQLQPAAWVDGNLFLVKTSMLQQIGGFDNRYQYGEWIFKDVCLKLKRQGYSSFWLPQVCGVRVKHLYEYKLTSEQVSWYEVRNHRLFRYLHQGTKR